MKLAILAFLVIFGVQAQEFLTQDQKEIALWKIDTICSDTWCEGDYNFKFNQINCDIKSKVCAVDMTMFEEGFCYSTTCRIPDISNFLDIVVKQELNDRFYDKLSDCILEEEKLFTRNRVACSLYLQN